MRSAEEARRALQEAETAWAAHPADERLLKQVQQARARLAAAVGMTTRAGIGLQCPRCGEADVIRRRAPVSLRLLRRLGFRMLVYRCRACDETWVHWGMRNGGKDAPPPDE
jgi:hypothetical protein